MTPDLRIVRLVSIGFPVWLMITAAPGAANSEPPAKAPVSSILPAGTRILVATNNELSTKTNKVGDRFGITVVRDVVDGPTIVIPQGTPGYGEVTFVTRKGAFGKPGILMIALRYLDLGGKQIALDGRYREEGSNNAGATAVTMFAVGILAGAIQGKQGGIPAGRELKARTGQDVTFVPGAPPPLPPPPAAPVQNPSSPQ